MRVLARLWRSESGQDVVEYVLLVGFVVLSSAGLMLQSGGSLSKVWTAANSALVTSPGATQSAASSATPPDTTQPVTQPPSGGFHHDDR